MFETLGLIYQSDGGHHSITKLMLLRSPTLDYGYSGCLTAHLEASKRKFIKTSSLIIYLFMFFFLKKFMFHRSIFNFAINKALYEGGGNMIKI